MFFGAMFCALFVDVFFDAFFPAMSPLEFSGENGEAGRDDQKGGARQHQECYTDEQNDAAYDTDQNFFGLVFQGIAKWRETGSAPSGCGLIRPSGYPCYWT